MFGKVVSPLGVFSCFTGRQYRTYREIIRALMNKEVEGALIDMYVVSTNKDLSSNPNLRVFKVYDYQKTYGVVLTGVSMKLEKCFRDFVKLNKRDIFHKVEESVKWPMVITFMKTIGTFFLLAVSLSIFFFRFRPFLPIHLG